MLTLTALGDGNYAAASARTALLRLRGAGDPHHTTITNLPASGTFGGGFTASVSTNGDGTKSVTSNTPAVCSTSGLVVSYVGVGTCSLNAQVAAGADYLAATGTAQTFTIGRANSDHADHHEHPFTRQRVLRLHGQRRHDR